MQSLPQISEAEFEVMKVVWKKAPVSTNEVTDTLTKTTNWRPKTIQTLLKRLVQKGVLTYEKQSRVFIYTPLVEESAYLNQESHSFLKRFYAGKLSTMVSSYLEQEELSVEELSSLRTLLQAHEKKEGL